MPSVWRTTFHSLNYSVQRRGLWIYPDKDIWWINQVEGNEVGKDIGTKECMDKGLNGAYVQSPPAFCQACWEPLALKEVSCSLAAREGVISWPTVTPGRQFSALCLAQTALWSFWIIILKDWAEMLLYSFYSYCTISFSVLYFSLQFLWLIPLAAVFWLQPVVLQPFENTMAQTYVIIH